MAESRRSMGVMPAPLGDAPLLFCGVSPDRDGLAITRWKMRSRRWIPTGVRFAAARIVRSAAALPND